MNFLRSFFKRIKDFIWFKIPIPEIEEPKIEVIPKTSKEREQVKKIIKQYSGKRKLKRCIVKDKVCFDEKMAKQTAILKSNSFTKIRAYLCEFCGKWHLTHKKNYL